MDKSVIAFLNRVSNDPLDQIARRSIRASIGLKALWQNADDRGDLQARDAVATAIGFALQAFACINIQKRYAFAGLIDSHVPAMTDALLAHDLPTDVAEALASQAEHVLVSLRDVLTPICAIHSPGPKMILRGDHCRAAIAGLRPVNDN
jgi:hypothetical protein